MTITTVEIPADRRLIIDIPREIPEGKARFEYNIIPFVKKDAQVSKPVLKDKNGKIRLTKELKEELLADETLRSLTGILHTDMTIEEIRDERLAKHL